MSTSEIQAALDAVEAAKAALSAAEDALRAQEAPVAVVAPDPTITSEPSPEPVTEPQDASGTPSSELTGGSPDTTTPESAAPGPDVARDGTQYKSGPTDPIPVPPPSPSPAEESASVQYGDQTNVDDPATVVAPDAAEAAAVQYTTPDPVAPQVVPPDTEGL